MARSVPTTVAPSTPGRTPSRDTRPGPGCTAVAARAQPFVAAGDRRLPVAGLLGELLPAGGVQRGSTVAVDGCAGLGVDDRRAHARRGRHRRGRVGRGRRSLDGTLGARVPRPRRAWSSNGWRSCRRAPPDRWGAVVAALLDGITVVVAAVPPHVRLGDARRLVARARERGAVLVAFGAWPVEAAVRVHTGPSRWRGLGPGLGLLDARDLNVQRRGEGPRVSRGRDDAHVLRVVSRLAGGRGAPARSVVAGGARVRARTGRCARARARGVGRGPRRRRDARHAAAGSRGAVSRRGVRRRRRRARGAHVRDRRPRDREAHAARRARPSGAVRVHDPRAVALLRWRRCARPARARGSRRRARRRPTASRPTRSGSASPTAGSRRGSRRAGPRHEAPFVVEPGGSAAFCAPWPVAVLGDPELVSLLVRLGLPTLGDVAALPADAVLARFGARRPSFPRSRTRSRCRAAGARHPAAGSRRADGARSARRRGSTQVAFAAKGLADRLLFRLAERGLACTRVVIEAETEHGERLARCWRHDRVLTPAALAERVRWQLDGWLAASVDLREDEDLDDTTGGLTLLRLVPDEVVPADGRQLGFWGGDQAAHDRADRALARVQGLLGYEAVATAVVQGGRTPAEQVRWVPWGDAREPQRPLVVDTFPAAWPGALPSPFPARVFDPPAPAQLSDEHGRAVVVSGRGEQSAAPARVECRCCRVAAAACGAGPVRGPPTCGGGTRPPRRRCARWQVVVDCGADAWRRRVRGHGGSRPGRRRSDLRLTRETNVYIWRPRTPSCTVTRTSRSSTGPAIPRSWPRRRCGSGSRALALTDHDGFYGVVRFAEAARAVDLPTVFGAELTLGRQASSPTGSPTRPVST